MPNGVMFTKAALRGEEQTGARSTRSKTTSIHDFTHNLTVLCPEPFLVSHHEKPTPFVDPYQVQHDSLMWTRDY